MSNVRAITDGEFQSEVVESELPVVVDFWAPWCGPCRMVAPVLDALSKEFATQVRFVKVNVDEDPQHAAHFGVQGIPTLLFFKDGEMVNRQVGVLPEDALRAKLQQTFGVGAQA